jgi:hypothetical protein
LAPGKLTEYFQIFSKYICIHIWNGIGFSGGDGDTDVAKVLRYERREENTVGL